MCVNEQLNERLLVLVDWIGEIGKEIENGTREQVPELIREMLAWEFWSNAIEGGICLALLITSLLVFRWGVEERD